MPSDSRLLITKNPCLVNWRVTLICLTLILMIVVVFGQALHFGFTLYDDDLYVTKNQVVLGGLTLSGVSRVLTSPMCAFFHPLTMLSLMLDHQLYGLWAGGYHLTNLLLHAASSILLFLVLRSMMGVFWKSALVAALFAIHPLSVEPTVWIGLRKDLLGGLFFMLTMAAYLRYVRRPFSWTNYLLVLLLFIMGLLSKPNLVMLPMVLLLLDYWPLHRWNTALFGKMILEKVPLFLFSLVVSVVTYFAEGNAVETLFRYSISVRLANALISYVTYIRQAVIPLSLSNYYPHPSVSIDWWMSRVSLALLVLLSWWVLRLRSTRPYLLVGWFWYLLMLIPVIGLVQIGNFSHADRYMYLPQIGLFIGAVWLIEEFSKRIKIPQGVLGALVAALLVSLILLAHKQTDYWKNPFALLTHSLEVTGDNETTLNNLASLLQQNGQLEKALLCYRMALKISPQDAKVRNNLGLCLVKMGRRGEAIEEFRAALRSNPYYVDAYGNLGCALMEEGKPEEALEYLKKGLALNPTSPQLHYNMGMDLIVLGRGTESACEFEEVIRRDSEFQDVQHQVGKALLQLGRRKEAIDHLERANLADPSSTQVMNDLAWALATVPEENLRNGEKALELALEANKATGESDPYILDTLAAAYAETGNYPEALKSARRAQELARKAGISELADNLVREIALYESQKPLRDSQ